MKYDKAYFFFLEQGSWVNYAFHWNYMIIVMIFLKDIDMRDIDTYLDLFAMIFLLFCSICLFLLHISYDEKNMYVKYFCFCDTYSFDSILCLGIDYHLFKHPTVIYKNKKKNKIKTSFIGLLYPSKKKNERIYQVY